VDDDLKYYFSQSSFNVVQLQDIKLFALLNFIRHS